MEATEARKVGPTEKVVTCEADESRWTNLGIASPLDGHGHVGDADDRRFAGRTGKCRRVLRLVKDGVWVYRS